LNKLLKFAKKHLINLNNNLIIKISILVIVERHVIELYLMKLELFALI